MKILFLGNNRVGWQALRFLRDRGEDIVGLVLHPEAKRRYGPEILAAAHLPPDRILSAEALDTPEGLAKVRAFGADAAVSVLFGYILRAPFLDSFPQGVVNLHPSLLPYNRGSYPNVWSIVEGTPAGATFHYIDAGVDTGDIIAQQRIEVEPVDTGASLYQKLEKAALGLLEASWDRFASGQASRLPQGGDKGTSHRTADVDRLDEIDLDRSYTGRTLLDILRARTFPPYKGAYFRSGGKKIYLRLLLEYGEDP